MRVPLSIAAACITGCITPVLAAKSAETIDCGAVPATVRKASAQHTSKSSTPPACERITDGKNVLFEVKVTSSAGRMQEWVYRPDGTLEESEEEIPANECPADALAAIRKGVGKGNLRKIDRLERGRQVFYEGEYTLDGVKRKIIVDAKGRVQP